MKTASVLVTLVSLSLLLNVPSVQARQIDERARVVLNLMDTVNRDNQIDRQELQEFLPRALRLRAERAGLGILTREAFDKYVKDVIEKVLNAAGPHFKPDDTIEAREISKMEEVSLPEPFGGTVANLLPKAPQKPPPQPSLLDRLEDWVDIRESFLDEQSIGKPAKFSLVNHATTDETVDEGKPRRVYTFKASIVLDGFVEWEPREGFFVRPIAGYEVNIESSAPTKDLIAYRGGMATDLVNSSDNLFTSHRFRTTFDIKTDRGHDALVYGATVQYTPNAPKIGVGRYLGGGAAIDFRWRPYLGVEHSNVEEPGEVEAYQKLNSFTHGFWRTTEEIRLGEHVKLTPETTLWHGKRVAPDGQVTRWHWYQSLEGRWILSESGGAERVSLSLSGALGRQSPDFKKKKSFELSLAFKF